MPSASEQMTNFLVGTQSQTPVWDCISPKLRFAAGGANCVGTAGVGGSAKQSFEERLSQARELGNEFRKFKLGKPVAFPEAAWREPAESS